MRADLAPHVVGLLQDRLAVFARLAEIDVDAVDVVALVLQPAENDRSIQTAGVRENATWHESFPIEKRRPEQRRTGA